MAIKNKLPELKEKKKRHGDIVEKVKKEGKITNANLVLTRINDLTDLILALMEETNAK